MPAPDVTLIAPYPPIGARHGGVSGVASYTANLAGALSAAGARVDVVAPLQDGRAADERDGAVRVRRCFARTSRGTARAFGAAVASGAPVVHLQHEFLLYGGPASNAGLAWGLRAVRRCRRASVATLHQVVDPGGVDRAFTRMHRVRMPAWLAGGGLSTMQRALSCSVDRVVVHEPAFAETVPGAAVVPHGVERATPIDRRRARATLGLEPERLCVLCFG
ncbi:MAG TPA: glycosyltransferase, partial [Solirubrobacteraceae bacterium]|nr:glycosyltransferase [Solirubrobacteraceae bacterium]